MSNTAADNPTPPTDPKALAPGSMAATEAGCTCPQMDNAYGRGYWRTGADKALFVIAYDCPLHGAASTGQQPEHANQRTAFGYHATAEVDEQADAAQAEVDAAQAAAILPPLDPLVDAAQEHDPAMYAGVPAAQARAELAAIAAYMHDSESQIAPDLSAYRDAQTELRAYYRDAESRTP